MIITIGGDAGSGKSTVAQELAKRKGYKYYSVGNLRRQMAATRGLTIEQYNKLGETDPKTDTEADAYQEKLGKKENDFVLESRLGWKFVPNSVKVFLTVDEKVAAERILKDHKAGKRSSEKNLETLRDALKEIQDRRKSDLKRYKKYYHVNHLDKKHYNIIIDTTRKTIEGVTDELMDAIKKRKK